MPSKVAKHVNLGARQTEIVQDFNICSTLRMIWVMIGEIPSECSSLSFSLLSISFEQSLFVHVG